MEQSSAVFEADRELIRALERRSQSVSCAEDRVLFSQGETPNGLYILRIGEVALTMRSDAGGVVIRLRVVSGSLLGLPAVIGNQPYSLTAVARKGSEVRFVAGRDFEYTLRIEPSLYPKVLQVLAAEVRAARKALAAV
jgi:CRP-like cAMP-binding protein